MANISDEKWVAEVERAWSALRPGVVMVVIMQDVYPNYSRYRVWPHPSNTEQHIVDWIVSVLVANAIPLSTNRLVLVFTKGLKEPALWARYKQLVANSDPSQQGRLPIFALLELVEHVSPRSNCESREEHKKR